MLPWALLALLIVGCIIALFAGKASEGYVDNAVDAHRVDVKKGFDAQIDAFKEVKKTLGNHAGRISKLEGSDNAQRLRLTALEQREDSDTFATVMAACTAGQTVRWDNAGATFECFDPASKKYVRRKVAGKVRKLKKRIAALEGRGAVANRTSPVPPKKAAKKARRRPGKATVRVTVRPGAH